ncbi:MAG TPA: electron transfer flavoprotein-ubiquinone oxidoreductase [Candidatus Marinimicrobia bacterium]|jgi:electron-transferring-flavoprotein dehydrogenase|nr:electron transfer flavoprotein [Candidatus Neomarinimicrobiota bacterium]MDP7216653.1 electron transfer flavoprotein-ubiquinone oxidoreductase [Candidatus Neomarinimicrobiota bacterium]MDP7437664.1 electron transfer flavoprotein-ubiquinone oxidoreductase [Candidatus Neomarinimicrobiota bacterium]HBN45437.1 electron transfer flavoprotein [Candidatus Neomarinimicrobiota bacterium]HJM70044.1 electron transfer flavoprotein-ubiquinone oxidoreductase [Candidatus Neomarinimicrobiota bacterium]|tara:strand:- start:15517 stop:17157 length:1641 start_codon:yes stop_codon:yes gene_type:complete
MSEREVLELDVLFVGAGPASLAGAIHLKQLLRESGQDASVAILEKASEVGAHSLSGAIVDPRALNELFPDKSVTDFPFEAEVAEEHLYYLTAAKKIPFPFVPPAMNHHNCFVTSLGKLTRWLGGICENEEVDIFCGFAGTELLYEGDRVIGVRTGDRGIDKNGQKKPQFEPGADIHAKVIILGEGTRGSLTKKLINRHDLMQGRNPQVWAVGVKELWRMSPGSVPQGYVAHTMGFPLGHNIFGGAFLYGMQNDIWDLGMVVGLDYKNPAVDAHHELQRLKNHPWLHSLLEGGEMIAYGAKSLPEGGWFSIPKLAVDGAMLIGDSAGFMNGQRLKGIHLSMKSGMLAAETIAEALSTDNFSAAQLADFELRVEKSWVKDELWKVRNFHQGFDNGLLAGLFNSGIGLLTGGRGWGFKNRISSESGHLKMEKKAERDRYNDLHFDGTYILDKVTDVYYSATAHEEDQVPHLHVRDQDVCTTTCAEEYGNPCTNFCPAGVYEMVPDGESQKLQINFSNCVHCKTCDIMDPYQIIDWVPPEGGDGPVWVNL